MKGALLLFVIVCTNFSYAGRPLKSDDAFFLGRYAFQLELATEFASDETGYHPTFPVTATYGFSDNTDVLFNLSLNSSFKIDCLDFAVKQNLLNIHKTTFALKSGLTSEVINSQISSPSAFFALVATVEYSDISLHFNAGYNQNNSEEEHKDLWFLSIAGEIPVSDQIIFAVDLGLGRDPSIHCKNPESYLLTGIAYNLTENFAIDTGFDFSINHSLEMNMVTIGTTIIFEVSGIRISQISFVRQLQSHCDN